MKRASAKVTVYGRYDCEPCKVLKEGLANAGIDFVEIDIMALPEEECAGVRSKILQVSRHDKATVPAVTVEIGGEVTWFSNHGLLDISEMLADIKAMLE